MAEFDKKQEDELINVMVSNLAAARKVLGLAAAIIAGHGGKSLAMVMVEENIWISIDPELAALAGIASTMIRNSGEGVPDE